jgi:hypothetical protein
MMGWSESYVTPDSDDEEEMTPETSAILMMGTEMVLETSAVFNQLTSLIAQCAYWVRYVSLYPFLPCNNERIFLKL